MNKNTFNALHTSFENKKTDLCKLQNQNYFERYILIRSLDKPHLQELIGSKTIKDKDTLYEKAFLSSISQSEIIKYIKQEYPKVKSRRDEQEKHLKKIIGEFGKVSCGVRNDDLNELAKELVRDRKIKSYKELVKEISCLSRERIGKYLEWQYFNQATNDLIEHYFNDHKKILPTLRKIRGVDFFLLTEEEGKELLPFDLKITHISEKYFELASSGLVRNKKAVIFDSYISRGHKSEIEIIKDFYKNKKNEFDLPNIGDQEKGDLLLNIQSKIKTKDAKNLKDKIMEIRRKTLSNVAKDPASLEWWNYKFQGERLFKNNNRFFIFLAYEDSFTDARSIKGNQELIKKQITKKLDSLTENEINKIQYRYEKDKSLKGDYIALSSSVLIKGKLSKGI